MHECINKPRFSFALPIQVERDDALIDLPQMEAIYSVQKMADVLEQGPDSERDFILFEVQQLLDHCREDTMKILIPVLCEHVPRWSIDTQIKSAQRLYDVVMLDLQPHIANMITCASFGVIHSHRAKIAPEYDELYNLWGSILVEALPNMEWTPQEIRDVVALVDIHAREPLYTSRKVAARVLGALAQCLDNLRVEKVVLPRAIALFDDTDVEVRGMVVESLAHIGANLPLRVTETEVWPRIERLLQPGEEARLRATAMRTMAHILEAHRNSSSAPSRLYREFLPPVFARLSAFARKYAAEDQRLVDDDTYLLLEVASEIFGQFVYSLALYTRKSFRKEAYKAYTGMATCNGPLIRRNCAFNLPGVAKALGERYALELSGLCEYLAKDTDEDVRWILAAGIHETTALLAPRGNFERLFTAVCSLLQDENAMVRMNALAHFHDLLTAFAKDGSDPASIRRLAPVFTDLTMLSEGEWRIQKSLAEQLGKCVDIIPPDALMDSVLPLLYRLMKQGTPLVREAAMDATAKSIRKLPNQRQRDVAIDKYWRVAAKGPFWMRLALLDGGTAAMKVFSSSRFKELFATDMLRLASDDVANVRIRVAALLADMAPMCVGLPAFDDAVSQLKNDVDHDVRAILNGHDERAREACKKAKEYAHDDMQKYKEEQEFYGIVAKTQKRARARLHSARGNRIMMHVRRPSMESSGQLSVSKAVINAAKASSAAASVARTARPGTPDATSSGTSAVPSKLAPADSTLYLGAGMEAEAAIAMDNASVNGNNANNNEEKAAAMAAAAAGVIAVNVSNGSTSVLRALAQSQNGAVLGNDYARYQSARQRSMNIHGDGVPVVQQRRGASAAGYNQARSKSWNGMLAQLPRQLSMEARKRREARHESQLHGWGKGGKKSLSALRRRRKKEQSELGQGSENVMDVRADWHVLAAKASSLERGNDFASMSALGGGPPGVAVGSTGGGGGGGGGAGGAGGVGGMGGVGAVGGMDIPTGYEEGDGIGSFRVPWKRSKTGGDVRNGGGGSFHVGGWRGGRNGSGGASSAGTGASAPAGSGGFLRGLFRRRR